MRLAAELVGTGLVAFGIVAGGSLFAGLAAIVLGRLPLRTMLAMADELKLWGTFAALGGTFTALKSIETGLFAGDLGVALRHLVHVLIAFAGAHLAFLLIRHLAEGG
ncbi:MAG TPA: YtrH family sporulation protein [Bacillota bacterium]